MVSEKESFELEQKLETIFNMFGLHKQIGKVYEEHKETLRAIDDYVHLQDKKNYDRMLEECIDQLVVILGIGTVHDTTPIDAMRMLHKAIDRTVSIIGQMDKNVEPTREYRRIRRGTA